MMLAAADPRFKGAVLTLMAGNAGLLASVLLSATLWRRWANPHPGPRALAHWAPMAAAVMVLAAIGDVRMAMGVIFGTSVALLSGVAGLTMLGAPPPCTIEKPGQSLWLLAVPATLLAFLSGFAGRVSLFSAVLLLVQGLMLLMAWWGNRRTGEDDPDHRSHHARPQLMALALLAEVALVWLACVSARLAHFGAGEMHMTNRLFTPGLLAATLVSAVLALPAASTATPLVSQGRSGSALTSHLIMVMLNLCLLVPATFVVYAALHHSGGWAGFRGVRMPYPLPVWRIDAVFLVILSLAGVPVALGRLKIETWVAVCLICLYGMYFMVAVLAGLLA